MGANFHMRNVRDGMQAQKRHVASFHGSAWVSEPDSGATRCGRSCGNERASSLTFGGIRNPWVAVSTPTRLPVVREPHAGQRRAPGVAVDPRWTASHTKEGWRLPFRALVPRLVRMSCWRGRRAIAGNRKKDRGREEGGSRTRGESRQVPRRTPLSPAPKLGGSDAPHVWAAQFSRPNRRSASGQPKGRKCTQYTF